MGYPRNQLTFLAMAAAMAALAGLAHAEVLVYKAENKWVAPEDNKPLQSLLHAARNGKTTYTVKLPATGRTLAIARLEVLKDLLAREAKAPIIMEETGTAKKSNTLEIN